MLEQANRLLDIYSHSSQVSNQFAGYERKRIERLMDLFNNNRSKYQLKTEFYSNLMDIVFDSFSKIPFIMELQSSKPSIALFDEIMTESTDSNEIKKFIRQCNFEFIGYHCNHNTIDEKCDKVVKSVSDIYNSKDYQTYKSFIQSCVNKIGYIIENDSAESADYTNEEVDMMMDFHDMFHDDTIPDSLCRCDSNEVEQVINAAIRINAAISESNSKTIKSCSKCDAMRRKYEYCLHEIQRMRNDLHEQLVIDESFNEQPAEKKFDIDEFMNKNYPTMKRIPLSDIQKRYKAVFNLFIKQDELISLIESTKRFKVTASHNVKYVNRL